MDKHVRIVGIFVSAVGCIIFFAGLMTDHWADTDIDSIHWGLWNYCSNQTSLNSSVQANATLNSSFSTLPTAQQNNSTQENEEDEEDCDTFSLSSIPGAFHLVRALMVCGTIAFAYCVLSGRLFRHRIVKENSCTSTYLGELALVFGACTGMTGVLIFKSSYKSYDFDDYGEPELGFSHGAAQTGIIIIGVGVFLMMASVLEKKVFKRRGGEMVCFNLSFNELKDDPFGTFFRCLLCQKRQAPHTSEPTHNPEIEGSRRHSVTSHDISFDIETNIDIFMVDVRNSSPNSSSPSLTLPLNDNISYSEPAPRYEDLSPRESDELPPPPSYDEALTGVYSVTDASTTSAPTSRPLVPAAPLLITDRSESPPPSYEETLA